MMGLMREQEQLAGGGALVVSHVHGRGAVAFVQPVEQGAWPRQAWARAPCRGLRLLLELGELLLKRLDVGEDELGHDGVGVPGRVHEVGRATNLTHDVGVGEVADDLADGVGLADVRQELVAQALALGGTLHKAGDVHELHRGRHDAARMHDVGELLETAVWHVDNAHVGLDGGKGVVGGEAALLGEGREQGGLADVGQADDTDG